MSAVFRKIFMTLIGLSAGAASWGVIELLIRYGDSVSRHVLWNTVAGASLGLIFGFFLGCAEGIIISDVRRSARGGLSGAIIGLIGGAAAVLLAQGVVYALGNAEVVASSVSERWVVPLARSLGWGFLGLVTGSVDGIRSVSARRTGIGMAGGILGGLLGGLLLEFLTRHWSNGFLARGIGIMVMGLGIGLFFSLLEYTRAYGLIRVLTGADRGREYILIMRKTRIGSSRRADIPLREYQGVTGNHAVLIAGRDGVTLRNAEGKTLVNERPASKQELKYEDVIQIGNAKLFYLPGQV